MKSRFIFSLLLLLTFCSILVFQSSCKKKEAVQEPQYLTVSLSRLALQNSLYYSMDYLERAIELDFSQQLDTSTLPGNISLSDKGGYLDTVYTTVLSGRKVILAFRPDFRFKDGWRYLLTIKAGLRSASGLALSSNTIIEIRTISRHLLVDNDTTKRNSILCISDIHMGDARASALGYCWFGKNEQALESLLNSVLSNEQVRQVVILGDLFDEWVVPYRVAPFDTLHGIRNSRDYFLSVAGSPVNIGVINVLKSIAAGGAVRLIYVPGNHDMLLTKDILQEIIPGIVWMGDSTGLGHYSPVSEMTMEHGHRYDFFNCPQPLSNPGHMLPPGYFVSRLDAEGLMEHGSGGHPETKSGQDQLEFLTAWTAAIEYLKIHYSLTVAADSSNILMGGIDNYTAKFSFNGSREMFASNIENTWFSTETRNGVAVSMPVIMAILNGSLDLSFAASYEFMQSEAPTRFKLVAFGHTHNPMISVFPPGKQYTGIYANTGSWVNSDLSSKPVRTFLVIKPGEWTGSDLDVVSLFQYNLNSGSGNQNPDYIPELISEESIVRAN